MPENNYINKDSIKKEIECIIGEFNSNDNPFPIYVFPDRIIKIIKETHNCLEFDKGYISISLMYAFSVAIGNIYKVQLKPGFIENCVLFAAIVGPPGVGKSHPMSWALKPIRDQDQKSYNIYLEKRKYYEDALLMTKKEREEMGIEVEQPKWRKYLLQDHTFESLSMIHHNNLRSIGVACDELLQFFKNQNRYNSGSDQEGWLSIWSGEPLTVDRKTAEPISIRHPHISVLGSIQTALLKELANNNRGVSGFLDRILFVYNYNAKKPYWSDKELDDSISQSWSSMLKGLFTLPYEYDENDNYKSKIMKFSADSRKHLMAWQRSNTDQANGQANEFLKGIYSKMDIYAIRFSLLLEIMESCCSEFISTQISIESVRGSIALVEYFKKTAIEIYSKIMEVSPVDKLPLDRQKYYRALPIHFETKQALELGQKFEIPRRTIQHFLKSNPKLFTRDSRGKYSRKIAK